MRRANKPRHEYAELFFELIEKHDICSECLETRERNQLSNIEDLIPENYIEENNLELLCDCCVIKDFEVGITNVQYQRYSKKKCEAKEIF